MAKTISFKTKNNDNTFFLNNSTDYSKTLDNIILTDIIKKNSYLFNTNKKYKSNTYIPISSYLKDDDFIKAANYLANYKKYKNAINIPYTFGKMYTLNDGTRIVFYDDEIQIGSLFYKYSDFNDFDFLNSISEPTKKIIINITINLL